VEIHLVTYKHKRYNMVQMLEVVHTITHGKRFWYNAKMSELGELYISMTLKTFAFSMIGVFVPIYLYQLGFSLQTIALYYSMYFIFRAPFNYLAGELTAKYGPKHVMSYAYVLTLVYLGMLMTIQYFNWSLWAIAFFASVSISFFFIGYHVDFSRIQVSKAVGSELSHVYLLQKVASAVGPLLGGLLAMTFGMHVVIGVSIVFILLAILPLMMTREPMLARERMSFKDLPIRKEFRNIVSFGAVGVGRQLTLSLWPLYIAVFIFSENIYGMVGFVTSISVVASILMAKMIGSLIDNHKGGALVQYSTLFLTVIYSLRATVSSLAGVVGLNIVSEFSETGVLLPLTKGMYARANTVKDRIAYVVLMETSIVVIRAFFWLFVAILLANIDQQLAFKIVFILVALMTPLTLVHNFGALKRRS